MNTNQAWNDHYERPRAKLSYPDENLVRLLTRSSPGPALDLGCGSGRHLALLNDLGFSPLTGFDASETSTRLCRGLFPDANIGDLDPAMLEKNEFHLPVPDAAFQVVVIWGVLHYNGEALRDAMLAEISRILRPGGRVLGTLRAGGDTHFQANADINTAEMHYFREDQARDMLTRRFKRVELGYMERTPVGDLKSRVCHWIFEAGNE